ncbi:MAG: hypothetical protein ACLPN1_17380 [Dissulfurispiraceae bacterium]
MNNSRDNSHGNGDKASKNGDELTANANRRKKSGLTYLGGGNIAYEIAVAIIAFPVWFTRAMLIKSKSGRSLKEILREQPQLFEDSIGIVFILLLIGFVILMYVNNR